MNPRPKSIVISLVTLSLFAAAASAADFNRYAFTLEMKEGQSISSSGTGCLVKYENATYYVTARHVFKNSDDKELAASLKALTIVNLSDRKIRAKPEAMMPVADAKDLSQNDFLILSTKSLPSLTKYTLQLATSPPDKDETVYLAARLPERPLATYPLKVLESSDELANYEKIPDVEKYTGASGGPIINSQGQLVGTYLGRRHDANQVTRSLIGTPLPALKNILQNLPASTRYSALKPASP
jgi:hypothetical protein